MKFKSLKENCMKESVQNTTNMTFIYVMPLQENENGVISNGVPPNNHAPNSAEPPPTEEPPKQSAMSKLFSFFRKPKKQQPPTGNAGEGSTLTVAPHAGAEEAAGENTSIRIMEEEKPPTFWSKLFKRNTKVGDSTTNVGSLPKISKSSKGTEDENWAERRDSIISEPPKKVPFSQKLKKVFRCGKKDDANRRASMMSKKKSMSSTMQPPIEKSKNKPKDTGPKLNDSLVEHASHMRGAIPVLPVPLAWICLVFNIFLPGVGTILSGLICLCIGKPRFSPRDSAKARFGAFLIDIIVGISQCFTVLFCLVGWGWSIWWGVIMLKIARKYRKIKAAEKNAIEDIEQTVPSVNVNHANQDVERGRT